jgi:hypothetical protein
MAASFSTTLQFENAQPSFFTADELTELFLIALNDFLPELGSTDHNQFFKVMLLRLGMTHASKGTSIFGDAYQRENIRKIDGRFRDYHPFKSNLHLFEEVTLRRLNDDKEDYNVLLPDHPMVKKIVSYFINTYEIKRNYPNALITSSTTKSDDRRYFWISSPNQGLIKHLILLLGFVGCFPSKDNQLAIYSDLYPDVVALFSDELKKMNPKGITRTDYKPEFKESNLIKSEIMAQLVAMSKVCHTAQQRFYINLLEKLISPLSQSSLENDLLIKQFGLGLERIKFILHKAMANRFRRRAFLIYIEFIFDEITFLLALTKPYKKADTQAVLTGFIRTLYTTDLPIPVMLTSSGMSAITASLFAAFEEFKDQSFNLLFQGKSYYEILILLTQVFGGDCFGGSLFSQKIRDRREYEYKDFVISFSPYLEEPGHYKITDIAYYNGQKVQIVMSAFENNVGNIYSGFSHQDVPHLISHQLSCRNIPEKKSSVREDKAIVANRSLEDKLIVILDTTMTVIDDGHLPFLLTLHEDDILMGRLALIIAHSLNKFFHLGLDKLHAGMTNVICNQAKYPEMFRALQAPLLEGDFLESDPIPCIVTHLARYAPSAILDYPHLIKENVRYLHKKFFSTLIKSDGCLIVDSPYSTHEYLNVWPFVTIRINRLFQDIQERVRANKLLTIIGPVLIANGIIPRDGYGFSETTYVFSADFVRINVGTESQDELDRMFLPVLEFLNAINQTAMLEQNLLTYAAFSCIVRNEISYAVNKQLGVFIELQLQSKIDNRDVNRLFSLVVHHLIKISGVLEIRGVVFIKGKSSVRLSGELESKAIFHEKSKSFVAYAQLVGSIAQKYITTLPANKDEALEVQVDEYSKEVKETSTRFLNELGVNIETILYQRRLSFFLSNPLLELGNSTNNQSVRPSMSG